MADLVAHRREHPGDDMTSALIAARDTTTTTTATGAAGADTGAGGEGEGRGSARRNSSTA